MGPQARGDQLSCHLGRLDLKFSGLDFLLAIIKIVPPELADNFKLEKLRTEEKKKTFCVSLVQRFLESQILTLKFKF